MPPKVSLSADRVFDISKQHFEQKNFPEAVQNSLNAVELYGQEAGDHTEEIADCYLLCVKASLQVKSESEKSPVDYLLLAIKAIGRIQERTGSVENAQRYEQLATLCQTAKEYGKAKHYFNLAKEKYLNISNCEQDVTRCQQHLDGLEAKTQRPRRPRPPWLNGVFSFFGFNSNDSAVVSPTSPTSPTNSSF